MKYATPKAESPPTRRKCKSSLRCWVCCVRGRGIPDRPDPKVRTLWTSVLVEDVDSTQPQGVKVAHG